MLTLIFAVVAAQKPPLPTSDAIWRPATKEELKLVSPKTRAFKAKERAFFKCDFKALEARLRKSPGVSTPEAKRGTYVVSFPMPDGKLQAFSVSHYPTEFGVNVEATAPESGMTLRGRCGPTLIRVTISGPKLRFEIGIDPVAPSKENLYGSYFLGS